MRLQTVDEDLLAELDAEPSDVRLDQYDAEWGELDTEQGGKNQYEASTTQLLAVAVGTVEPTEESLVGRDATLSSTTIQPNESVSATATVDNPTADAVANESADTLTVSESTDDKIHGFGLEVQLSRLWHSQPLEKENCRRTN